MQRNCCCNEKIAELRNLLILLHPTWSYFSTMVPNSHRKNLTWKSHCAIFNDLKDLESSKTDFEWAFKKVTIQYLTLSFFCDEQVWFLFLNTPLRPPRWVWNGSFRLWSSFQYRFIFITSVACGVSTKTS
jgi:hypothetical protein